MFLWNYFTGKSKREKKDYQKVDITQLRQIAGQRRKELLEARRLDSLEREEWEERKGLTGICNMGNTCYMNTALQCLSHTMGLTEYILTGQFKQEVNAVNNLGTEGELLCEYASLLHLLWAKDINKRVKPADFKNRLENECADVISALK